VKEIKAAGAIVYRTSDVDSGEVEILLVHRPRYQDWSFPKGKLDSGEAAEVAACREVHEETGYPIVLDSSIGRIKYHTEGVKDLKVQTRKSVQYYIGHVVPEGYPALKVRETVKPASPKEIDGVKWVRISEALELLTYRDDIKLLQQFVTQFNNDSSVIVQVKRVKPKIRTGSGKKIANPKFNQQISQTTGFLSSMGIEVLVVLSKKTSASSTFIQYAEQTKYPIHYLSPTDVQYTELLNQPNLRMAVVK
jgi:8-oxo-dGTP pyrophosphatase MutT (NUDIX family)